MLTLALLCTLLLSSILVLLTADVIANCLSVFNDRAAELEGDLCRLALLLDPRYKDVAASVTNTDIMLGKV